MKLLREIKDNEWPENKSILKTREASRAVLFDENDLIPLLFVAEHNYHKLPGGGINDGEDSAQALVRECLEETGSKIKVFGEVGKIVEFRSKWNLKQTSYCYFGRIISKGKPDFTEKELSQGFRLVWLPIKEAITKMKSDKPENYEGVFIQKRDLVFVKKAQQIIKVSQ
jgi:8-oxo-dGTP pyrophosphatase MutT (NUDIX family)